MLRLGLGGMGGMGGAEAAIALEVKRIVEVGAAKFEVRGGAERAKHTHEGGRKEVSQVRSVAQTQQGGGSAAASRRVVEVNRSRVKVLKPGLRTPFSSTELKGSFDPPFRVRP